jgi:SAM-dependent methyltransferase
MYSDVFCRIYNELGWNYYPEIFGEILLKWMERRGIRPGKVMDLGCGTGVLCRVLRSAGIRADGMDLSQGMIRIAREADPQGRYYTADMVTFRPEDKYDLVTCTGDALNHIPALDDLNRIFENVYSFLNSGGFFLFDMLNEREVSDEEPFEMDFSDTIRVWFQMTRPETRGVNLKVRVFENGKLSLEENIRETIHDPAVICRMLTERGFLVERCADRLLEDGAEGGTTWFVVATKSEV